MMWNRLTMRIASEPKALAAAQKAEEAFTKLQSQMAQARTAMVNAKSAHRDALENFKSVERRVGMRAAEK